MIALVFYHIWWPCPFISDNFAIMQRPRKTHIELEDLADEGNDDLAEEERLVGSSS